MQKRHLGNISRQVGHDVSKKYSYIVNQDELTNAYFQMREELNYPLMMESRYRRAIVYNKQGLGNKIIEIINACIGENINELENMIAEEVANDIIDRINGLSQAANGNIIKSNNRIKNNTYKFAKIIAKGITKGVGDLIDDIINPKED